MTSHPRLSLTSTHFKYRTLPSSHIDRLQLVWQGPGFRASHHPAWSSLGRGIFLTGAAASFQLERSSGEALGCRVRRQYSYARSGRRSHDRCPLCVRPSSLGIKSRWLVFHFRPTDWPSTLSPRTRAEHGRQPHPVVFCPRPRPHHWRERGRARLSLVHHVDLGNFQLNLRVRRSVDVARSGEREARRRGHGRDKGADLDVGRSQARGGLRGAVERCPVNARVVWRRPNRAIVEASSRRSARSPSTCMI